MSDVAKACKWVSLPGEIRKLAVSTSTKSRAANQARRLDTMRPRAMRIGRRCACISGVQNDEEGGGTCGMVLSSMFLAGRQSRNNWLESPRSVWCARKLKANPHKPLQLRKP